MDNTNHRCISRCFFFAPDHLKDNTRTQRSRSFQMLDDGLGNISFFVNPVAPTQSTLHHASPLQRTFIASLEIFFLHRAILQTIFRQLDSPQDIPGVSCTDCGDSPACTSPTKRIRCGRLPSSWRFPVICYTPPPTCSSKGRASTAAGRSGGRRRRRRSWNQWYHLVVP